MKKKFQRFYEYKCTITEEQFQTTRPAPNPSELVSVKAYYQMHSDTDDRPEVVKMKLESQEEEVKPTEDKGPGAGSGTV